MDTFAKHCSHSISFTDQNEKRILRNVTDILGHFELGDEFTEGSLGYVWKPYELVIGLPLAAFADVAGNGYRRPLHVVAETKML